MEGNAEPGSDYSKTQRKHSRDVITSKSNSGLPDPELELDPRLTHKLLMKEILREEREQNHSLLDDDEEEEGSYSNSNDNDHSSRRKSSRGSSRALIDNTNGRVSPSGSRSRAPGTTIDVVDGTEADAFFISENRSSSGGNGKDNLRRPRPTGANRVIRDRVKDNNNRNSFPEEGEQPAADRLRQVKSKGESTFAIGMGNVDSQSEITIHLPNTKFNVNNHNDDDDERGSTSSNSKQPRLEDSNVEGSETGLLFSDKIVANSQSQARMMMVGGGDGDGDFIPQNDGQHPDRDQRQYTNSPVRQNFNQHQSTKATGMSVRCHCNLASCVTNNYMCKSERRVTEDGKVLEAGCFVQELENESSSTTASSSSSKSSSSSSPSQTSQHGVSVPVWNGRVATARRGCVEFLTREKQEQCSDKAGNPIQCCTQDMCNYPKSFYPSSVQQNLNSNRLSFDSSSAAGGMRGGNGGAAGMIPNLDHQVWLRAAVIAVPICGLMILVVLIVVARRLLQSDDDHKDPDGRRNRRKFSSSPPYYYHQQPQQLPQLPNNSPHHSYQPPSIHGSHRGVGLSYGQDSTFHVKPMYDTSEYLLPQDEHYCSPCQHSETPCSNSAHHHRSTSSSSNYNYPNLNSNNAHGDGSSSFNFAFRKNTNRNSETEELVNSRSCNNSSSGNSSQTCSCTGHVIEFAGGADNIVNCNGNGLDGQHDETTAPTPTSNFSSNSYRPPSLFSGSSPELPTLHHGKRFNFLSKIGLSRSTECESTALNSRPFHV